MEIHRIKASFHIARAGTGERANDVAGRRIPRAVRLACDQDRSGLFLEEGKLEFFKANGVACLPEPLCHVLRGTIVTGGACGTVAAARGGNILQRLQMAECTLAKRDVRQAAGRRAADDVVRAGHAAHGGHEHNCSQSETQARPTKVQ